MRSRRKIEIILAAKKKKNKTQGNGTDKQDWNIRTNIGLKL
jgi:hypothetical protein